MKTTKNSNYYLLETGDKASKDNYDQIFDITLKNPYWRALHGDFTITKKCKVRRPTKEFLKIILELESINDDLNKAIEKIANLAWSKK